MKKYLRLSCSVCKRTIDRLVDNTRFSTDKCTITLKCQGRLLPVQYRSDAQIAPAPEIGLTDWFPRGSASTVATPAAAPGFIDTGTGELQQLVLAVRLAAAPVDTATAQLTLQTRTETPKAFKSYLFQRTAEFTTISGVESGVSQKTLRFKAWGSDADQVDVYLNGVRVLPGTNPDNYQLDDGSANPPAPSNTIKFNSPVLPVGTFQVEVIVSKAVPAVTQTLTFLRNTDNDARLGLGAWENVSHLQRFDGAATSNFYLFTFDVKNNAVLTKDTVLFPVGGVVVLSGSTTQQVDSSNCFFALSRKPHYKVDRYPDISVQLTLLDGEASFLKYADVNDVLALSVTDTALQTHFPPSTVVKFNPEATIKVQVPGEDEQLVVDGKVIVGPDV